MVSVKPTLGSISISEKQATFAVVRRLMRTAWRQSFMFGFISVLAACGGGSGGGGGATQQAALLGAALPDEGRYIAISEQSIQLPESARLGSVSVVRNGSAENATSVAFRFVAGTASSTDDYHGSDGILSWRAGDNSTKLIPFRVASDIETELDETFHIELFDVSGGESLGVNDRVTVNINDVACSGLIPAVITGNTELSQPCYQLRQTTRVSASAQLSIPAGTTVVADKDTGFLFTNSANLSLAGQSSNPVVIKGAVATAGYWDGFSLQSNSALHRVDYGHISHATNAFVVSRGGVASFDNNVVSHSSGAAVSIPLTDAAVIGIHNRVESSAGGIELDGNHIANGESVVIPGNPVHYSLAGSLVNNGLLKLLPGTDLRVNADESIIVFQTGAINAVGTVDAPIFLQGVKPAVGFWNGIQYVSSDSDENQFAHTTIAHGGGDPARPGNVIIDGLHTRIAAQHCAFTHSEGYGIVYDANAFQVDIVDSIFVANKLGDQSL